MQALRSEDSASPLAYFFARYAIKSRISSSFIASSNPSGISDRFVPLRESISAFASCTVSFTVRTVTIASFFLHNPVITRPSFR